MPGTASLSETNNAFAQGTQAYSSFFFTGPFADLLPPRLGLGWSRSHNLEDGRYGESLRREAITDAVLPDVDKIEARGARSRMMPGGVSSIDHDSTHMTDAISLGPKRFGKQASLHSRTFPYRAYLDSRSLTLTARPRQLLPLRKVEWSRTTAAWCLTKGGIFGI